MPNGSASESGSTTDTTESLLEKYNTVRAWTEKLCEPLEFEDFVIQSMPDVSPTRWHIAHTTWFFETFVLQQANPDYQPFDPTFGYLFNSYYNTVGRQFQRDRRGLLSRPTVREIFEYRQSVDRNMRSLMASDTCDERFLQIVQLGLQHEQQHQELMLTDIKHVFSQNPLHPVYRPRTVESTEYPPLEWIEISEGLRWMGHAGNGFAFDNESPRHQQFLQPSVIGADLVSCGQYIEFIESGGYSSPRALAFRRMGHSSV